MTIVKVQTPLFSSEPNMPALVYDERKSHVIQQHLRGRAVAAMGTDYKAFFEAEWDGAEWTIGKRVDDQPW